MLLAHEVLKVRHHLFISCHYNITIDVYLFRGCYIIEIIEGSRSMLLNTDLSNFHTYRHAILTVDDDQYVRYTDPSSSQLSSSFSSSCQYFIRNKVKWNTISSHNLSL